MEICNLSIVSFELNSIKVIAGITKKGFCGLILLNHEYQMFEEFIAFFW